MKDNTYMQLIEDEESKPKCPHCEVEIQELKYSYIEYKTGGFGGEHGQQALVYCPHCLKFLHLGFGS